MPCCRPGEPAGRRARAFIEVPSEADALPLVLPTGCEITWLARDAAAHGERLYAAVRGWAESNTALVRTAVATAPQPLAEIDVDCDPLWESPSNAAGTGFYAWLAGESCMIKLLRRFLVSETGIERSRVAFMGYWRLGRSEGQ